jgi:hypothetical protein
MLDLSWIGTGLLSGIIAALLWVYAERAGWI